MKPTIHPDAVAALAPLRAELLRRARADADRIQRDAAETTAGAVAAATANGEEIIAAALARGESEAAQYRATRLARARRGIRADRLAAERAVFDEMAGRVQDAVCGLRHEPGHERLRCLLADRARAVLGPGATVTEASDGGIAAAGPVTRLDYSLAGFAERAIERAGADVSRLWTE